MERDGRGGKREKINQGGPDPGLMSRRTCANRSGSLAGGPSLPCRVDSNFLPHDLDSTAAYLNPVLTLQYFSFASLPPLFIIIIFIFPRPFSPFLRQFGHLPSPLLHYVSLKTHAVNLNPPANLPPVLFFSLILSLSSQLSPSPLPTNPRHPSHSCLQKAAQRQGLCAVPSPLRGQLARSSSLPAENVQIIGFVSFSPLACFISVKAMR